MAELIPQALLVTGTDLTLVAAEASDKVPPGCYIVVRNGSGVSTTVTVTVPGDTKYGVAQPDYTKAVAAGDTAMFGPLPEDLADPVDGKVTFACAPNATITVGAVR